MTLGAGFESKIFTQVQLIFFASHLLFEDTSFLLSASAIMPSSHCYASPPQWTLIRLELTAQISPFFCKLSWLQCFITAQKKKTLTHT